MAEDGIKQARHEKRAFASKKFIAFLVCEVGFFLLMAIMLFEQEMSELGENMAFMVLAVTAGTLASFFIGGQALVDRYVRVATIMTGHSEKSDS